MLVGVSNLHVYSPSPRAGGAVGPDLDALPELYVTNFSNQSNSYYANLTAAADDPWFEETGEQSGCGR